MAVTENTYTGNGSTVLYSFTFPYLDEADIKVTLNGTPTTAYTLANATTIQFNTAPANGVAIRIYRETNIENLVATFFAGSAIRAVDLNNNATQALYFIQETFARALSTFGGTLTGILNMGGFKITNLGTPAASTDASTKAYVDATISAGIPDGNKGDITVSGTGTVFTLNNGTAGTKINPDFGSQNITTSGNVTLTGTGYLDLPAGTTAQRPGSPSSGMARYNTDLGLFEGYGTAWGKLGGGATGGGSDDVFFENGQTVTTNYTLTANKNAVTAGPITVNNGITVTIPSGSSWVIV